MRVPVHSLASLLQVDFRLPGSTDYTALLRATRMLTRDEREVQKAYARAVFNVLFHNRDDHPRNFAWRLAQDRQWKLAPAFDLTFSEGPGDSIIWMSAGWVIGSDVHTCWNLPGREVFHMQMQKP